MADVEIAPQDPPNMLNHHKRFRSKSGESEMSVDSGVALESRDETSFCATRDFRQEILHPKASTPLSIAVSDTKTIVYIREYLPPD
jgi:hypothetical protein